MHECILLYFTWTMLGVTTIRIMLLSSILSNHPNFGYKITKLLLQCYFRSFLEINDIVLFFVAIL